MALGGTPEKQEGTKVTSHRFRESEGAVLKYPASVQGFNGAKGVFLLCHLKKQKTKVALESKIATLDRQSIVL